MSTNYSYPAGTLTADLEYEDDRLSEDEPKWDREPVDGDALGRLRESVEGS